MASRQITWYPPEHTGLAPIVLTDRAAGYSVLKGMRGLGAVEHQLVTDESVWADGATVDADYVLPRSIMLPMHAIGADRDEFLARLATLTAAMRTRAPGARPTYGELELAQHDGRRWRVRCHYQGGLPDEETIESGGDTNWVRFQLRLFAPDPYWYAPEPTVLSWDFDEPAAFLGDPFLPLQLSPSQVLGDATIVNPGTESALGTWRITQPGTDFIAANTTTGETLRVTATIPSGQTLTIVTDPPDIYLDPAGTDWWPYLVDGSTLWEIPPGETPISLTLSGAAAGSRVELTFYERRGAPW
jgi:hypothetical protein